MKALACTYCQSERINKAGFTGNGKQRFYCRACRRFWREKATVTPNIPRNLRKPRVSALPSPGHLVLQLQAISQELKRTPTTNDINQLSKGHRAYSLSVYYEVFGSFTAAVKTAGLKTRYNQEFDREKLLAELQELRRKIGRALIAPDVLAARKRGLVSPLYHFSREFGSVPSAIAAAAAARPSFTRGEIISYLKRLRVELKRVPTGADIANRFVRGETPSLKEIIRNFGSLRLARAAAGIAYQSGSTVKKNKIQTNWQKYTPEQLIEQLQRVYREVGRKPTDRDLNRASAKGICASSTTFRRSFGNLAEAHRQAGFE